MKPGNIVIMRTPLYDRTGPDSYDHYIEEQPALVVSLNSDGTANLMALQPTHNGYKIDETGTAKRSCRTMQIHETFDGWYKKRVEET